MALAVKKPKRYNTAHDASMRLHQSIVRYKDIPVYLEEQAGFSFFVQALDGVSKVPKTVSGNDDNLDISSVPLGYVNVDGDTIYLSRIPSRQVKQGITPRIMRYYREGGMVTFKDPYGWPVPFVDLDRTIRNIYPSAQEAYARVRDGKTLGCAYNRRFAFSRTEEKPDLIRLRMAGDETIGIVKANEDRPKVSLLDPWCLMYNINSQVANAGIVILEE